MTWTAHIFKEIKGTFKPDPCFRLLSLVSMHHKSRWSKVEQALHRKLRKNWKFLLMKQETEHSTLFFFRASLLF